MSNPRRMVDCNKCRVIVPEPDAVHVEVQNWRAPVPLFDEWPQYHSQSAHFCLPCWLPLSEALSEKLGKKNA